MAEAPINGSGGYVLSAPGFEPPMTTADEGALSAKADDFFSLAGRITGQGGNLKQTIGQGAKEYSDIVADKIEKQGGYSEAASLKASRGAIWAGTVTDEYATDVMEYKQKIAALVEEYVAASEKNFGVDMDSAPNGNAVTARRNGYMARAQSMWEAFKTKAAMRGKFLKEGPTKDNLEKLATTSEMAWFSPAMFEGSTDGPTKTIEDMIRNGILPASFRYMDADAALKYVLANPDLAKQLRKNKAYAGVEGQETFINFFANLTGQRATKEGTLQNAPFAKVRQAFANMTPEERKWLSILYPEEVGNLDGVPFENRIDANTIRITDEYQVEKGREGVSGREELYKSILEDDRKIVVFDPNIKGETGKPDGAIAELHGDINAKTKDVGVLVGGTGSSLDNFDSFSKRGQGFADASNGDTAMISWVGADMPDRVAGSNGEEIVKDLDREHSASVNTYSRIAGPQLAEFSHSVRAEIDNHAAPNAKLTVAGHSYGGATVGVAEKYGLDADRILHIESAGMGVDVTKPDDYTTPDRERYSMTDPKDPIRFSQGVDIPAWAEHEPSKLNKLGHGADPDDFDGVTRLETGTNADGSKYAQPHSDVFNQDSTAWKNMLWVFTDGRHGEYERFTIPPTNEMPSADELPKPGDETREPQPEPNRQPEPAGR